MKFSISRKVRVGICVTLWTAALWIFAYDYLSRNKIQVNITSKTFGAIVVLGILAARLRQTAFYKSTDRLC